MAAKSERKLKEVTVTADEFTVTMLFGLMDMLFNLRGLSSGERQEFLRWRDEVRRLEEQIEKGLGE